MGLESMAILLRGGGVLIMLVCVSGVHFPPPLPGVPNWQGCTDNVSLSLPYCDPSLSIDQRVDWLVANLTLVEQIATISPQIELGDGCGVHTRGKPSIGLPNYFWLTEANTAVAASCYTADPTDPYRCATTFVGPMNMGASFNRSSWRAKGNVLGTELRAFNNLGWNRAREENYIGLTGFGPNINIARDPRFGRVSEVPSEDPIHSGVYGAEMISGMQTQDEAGHPKMIAYLKHYTAYSREQDRMHSEANISTFDLFDTYLPQYELAFQANASGVMCSYDSINGVPACASNFLLNEMIRDKWGQPNALVTTDCGAVSNMLGQLEPSPGRTRLAATPEEAAAWTIMNGTDLEMGSLIWTNHLLNATKIGLVTEARVARALRRGLRQQFIAGRFDSGVWADIGPSSINSSFHRQIQAEAALQGMVLLKNKDRTLPLTPGTNIAVVGPMGLTQLLTSDYAGADQAIGTRGEGGCWPLGDRSCVVTIAEAITQINNGTTHSSPGAAMSSASSPSNVTTDSKLIAEAVAIATKADVVILVLGNSRDQEHEGIDRGDIGLPANQAVLARAVLAIGKPTVLVLSNGGAIAFDELIDGAAAIVEAFNPAHNSIELAQLLFGKANRWGKLPVTIYSLNYTHGGEGLPAQPMAQYDMVASPGRTYRYYQGRPLFPFGWGLSYSLFSHTCDCYTAATDLICACTVNNTGEMAGDEVVMLYDSLSSNIRTDVGNSHPVPAKRLIDFSRVTIASHSSATVEFVVPKSSLYLTTADGDRKVYPGQHDLVFSRGNGEDAVVSVEI